MKNIIINSYPLLDGSKFNYNCPICSRVLKKENIKRIAGEVTVKNGNLTWDNCDMWLYMDVKCQCNTIVFINFMTNSIKLVI